MVDVPQVKSCPLPLNATLTPASQRHATQFAAQDARMEMGPEPRPGEAEQGQDTAMGGSVSAKSQLNPSLPCTRHGKGGSVTSAAKLSGVVRQVCAWGGRGMPRAVSAAAVAVRYLHSPTKAVPGGATLVLFPPSLRLCYW